MRSLGFRTVNDLQCVLVGAANNLIFEVGFESLDAEAKGDNIVMSRLISQARNTSSNTPCNTTPLATPHATPLATPHATQHL